MLTHSNPATGTNVVEEYCGVRRKRRRQWGRYNEKKIYNGEKMRKVPKCTLREISVLLRE